MRLHSILSSSAVIAALGLMIMGGCGGSVTEEEVADPALRDGELSSSPALSPHVTSDGKITLCHVPPGNPANARTLTVSEAGWNGHRHHKGDRLGACEDSGSPDAGTPPPEDGGTTPPDAGTPPTDGGTPEPTCSDVGGACGSEVLCCDGLFCTEEGTCQPIIG